MRIFYLFFVVTLSACFSSGPINNKEFGSIGKISDLNGTYLNVGDSGSKSSYKYYLSKMIWPKDKDVDHALIDTIVVLSISDTQLSVKGLHDNSIVKEQIFIEGKDFNIMSGRIQMLSDIGGVNDNIAGVTYTSVELGLDESGHGKYRKGESFAGVALLIPLIAHGTTDVRFLKVEEQPLSK